MRNPLRSPSILKRWMIFNFVGIMGVGVQLTTLWGLTSLFHFHYLVATVAAVEAAVLHNFIWHERWTWADRPAGRRGALFARLLCFHLANGFLSIAGNLVLMAVFVEKAGLSFLVANALAVAICAVLNFLAGDRFVFRSVAPLSKRGGKTMPGKIKAVAAVMAAFASFSLLANPASVGAADLGADTIRAWNSCVEITEQRISKELSAPNGFLALDFQDDAGSARERRDAMSGQIPIRQMPVNDLNGHAVDVPHGMIHHWRGSVFIPGVSLAFVFSRITNPTQDDMRQEDVLDSRVLARSPGELKVFLKLQRSKIITVVYNTEHLVRYKWHGLSKASSSSTAIRITEIERRGGDNEVEKPEGHDRGFLWRMNSYWRYQEVPGGVIVECESMTLSRSIPAVFEYMVRPIINKVAKESMHRTLQSMKTRILRSYALQTAEARS